MSQPASRLAAIVFAPDEAPDEAVASFVAELRADGLRVAGFLQTFVDGPRDGDRDALLQDIESGERLPIMQDLGPAAEGCRIDPDAMARAAAMLARGVETTPDLVVVNRFGRLESEGEGLLAEIGRAAADGRPLLICVPLRYRDAWNAFAAGVDTKLPASREAIATWWREVCAPAAST